MIHQPKKSGHQLHFEKRQVLDVTFTIKPFSIGESQFLFGMEMEVEQIKVQHIQEFLMKVKQSHPFAVSPTFTYDPSMHCFSNESDAIVQQLIHIVMDEKAYLDTVQNSTDATFNHQALLIPPSNWLGLFPLIINTPSVNLMQNGHMIHEISNG